MVKPRVIETDQGIQGELNVNIYDKMMRRLRDKGWIETNLILKAGIISGVALEVGPGPGYLGLEWLKKTRDTFLKGLDISPDMIKVSERNAEEYGLMDRVEYIQSDGKKIPFEGNTFDAVFTNGSLHEWSEPRKIFVEIHRVLKFDGKYCITDLRRDMLSIVKWFLWLMTKPKEIRPGLISSINASYTVKEIEKIIKETPLRGYKIERNVLGLVVSGTKKA